ncbi:hypothetical protein GWN26_06210, partial [Candidatus Saccharibacteria bacterium]|nr:hypothetical protein [Candidatus Saccharibacteria bacterium]NIV03657.1 hypothetical protein [Calditrichia bacterium]NIV71959.1 hypothetical protein [Calditrichia bacterium]NIV98749.1 hypothetical protein [Candidatus Saccharibacteria bacterium]NIW79015.1 hypothetical protein [Calditrichia bacterium]
MSKKGKPGDKLPDEFSTYEEAAEFWATHDTTDYLDFFEDVEVKAEFKNRHYELEVDEEIMKALRKQAQKRGISVTRLANEMLRKQIS